MRRLALLSVLGRYRVRLERDRYVWPAGAEEVAYPADRARFAAVFGGR
jgi:hypothetical protein